MRVTAAIVWLLVEAIARSIAELIPLDSAEAYTWEYSYPQSCECIETGVANTHCSFFECACTCDLTAGSCDYNCCCDPDCSSLQISHFENDNEYCDFSGTEPDEENLCYSTNDLYKVNPRSPVGGSSTTSNAVDELLCVTKVNKEYKGDFYDTPSWKSSSVFQSSEGQKSYDYDNEMGVVSSDDSYDKNDSIPVYYNSSVNGRVFNGYLPFPIADFSGRCNDNNHAKFQNSHSLQFCRRNLGGSEGADAFAQQCKTDISTEMFSSLIVAALPTDNLLKLETVPVVIDEVIFEDSISTLDVTAEWLSYDCITAYGNNATQNSNCQFSSDESTESGSNYCFNAVKSASLTVLHDQSSSSKILNVSLQLVVTNILLDAASNGFDLSQSYSINFFNSPSESAISNVYGNQVSRARSGNPGYIVGLPLIFGPVMNGVVNMSTAGLEVPVLTTSSTESLDCLDGRDIKKSNLKFGVDMKSGCSAAFNRSALRNFCLQKTLPSFLDVTEGYVGYFGNADPLDTSQWFSLASPPVGTAWEWNDATSVCSAMITGLSYKFLVGLAGEKSNPQYKIIGSTVQYISQDYRIRVPAHDEESKQRVVFSVSATFVFKENEELKGYTPPPPPGLLTVPYDVFYPFVTSTGNSNRPKYAGDILSILFCLLMYKLWY